MSDSSPQQIGPYRLHEPLARGGMGVVYRAEHIQRGTQAALKTLTEPHRDFLLAIRREIHALSQIHHPGIVRILDDGLDNGIPWLAMELLEGIPFFDFCGSAVEERVEFIRLAFPPLCMSLAYLHGEGLVHGDLKPANIVLVPAESTTQGPRSEMPQPAWSWRPVLVDFGLASRFPGGAGRETLEVEIDQYGTHAYLSPEQCAGESFDARADLYALGCILYEALTGSPPFKGGPVQLLWQHGWVKPDPPSARTPGIPPELDALVLRLLEKRPQDRIGHADDVAIALGGTDAADFPQPRAYLYRPRLVGRDATLEALRQPLDRLQNGNGGILLLSGEAGSGKTRLAAELVREARRRKIAVVAADCAPAGAPRSDGGGAAPSLEPLRPLLQDIADRCRERGEQETRKILGSRSSVLAAHDPSFATLPGLEAQAPLAELPPALARLRLYSALAETLAAYCDVSAGGAPLLLILDSFHLADELTLGFLEMLGRSELLEDMALLILVTARTDGNGSSGPPERLRSLADLAPTTQILLGPLDSPAATTILGDMLALEAPPKALVRSILRRAGGNPYFLAEHLRTAVDVGILRRDGTGRWRIEYRAVKEEIDRAGGGPTEQRQAGPGGTAVPSDSPSGDGDSRVFDALPLPQSLREMAARRFERLASGPRRLTAAAAVAGRQPTWLLVWKLARLDVPVLFDAMAQTLRRGLLEEPDPEHVRFANESLRLAAYEQIETQERRELHARAAEALEELLGHGADFVWEELGLHWEAAAEPERARRAYLAGARRARQRSALGEAERLYRASLRLSTKPNSESVEARNELAFDVFHAAGRNLDALEEHRLALEEARAIGDRVAESASLRGLGNACRLTGRPQLAHEYHEEALRVARAAGDRAGEHRALNNLALNHAELGRVDEAEALWQQALSVLQELRDDAGQGIVLGNLAMVLRQTGRIQEARGRFEHALALKRKVGNRREEGITLGNLANLELNEGRLDEALVLYNKALTIQREVGDRRGEAITVGNLGVLNHESGRPEEARALLDKAVLATASIGDRRLEGAMRICRGRLARQSGRVSEADPDLARGERLLREVGDRALQVSALAEQGHRALAAGRPADVFAKRARELGWGLELAPDSEAARALQRLERAQKVFDLGGKLVHGERPEDVPEGMMRWLQQTGLAGQDAKLAN